MTFKKKPDYHSVENLKPFKMVIKKLIIKKIPLFVFLFAFLYLCSQTNRFIYQLNWKLNGQEMKMNAVLDIDKDFVKFYDYKFLEIDSINTKFGEQSSRMNSMIDQVLLRKRNTNENKTFHNGAMNDYFAIVSKDKMNWRILKETREVESYKLQKAITQFGGREWIAWFSTELPFQEGPYKFRGLPGLIFELTDSENEFSYKLIKSQNLKQTYETINFLETHYGQKPLLINLKQYHKIMLDYYNEPASDMRKALEKGGTVNIMGENITNLQQFDQKRKFMQQMIKKYYNPLEKDTAIPYPVE